MNIERLLNSTCMSVEQKETKNWTYMVYRQARGKIIYYTYVKRKHKKRYRRGYKNEQICSSRETV